MPPVPAAGCRTGHRPARPGRRRRLAAAYGEKSARTSNSPLSFGHPGRLYTSASLEGPGPPTVDTAADGAVPLRSAAGDDRHIDRQRRRGSARQQEGSTVTGPSDWVPAGIDVNRPSAARVYDYFLGGAHN